MTYTEFLRLRVADAHEDGVTLECPLEPFYFNQDGSLHGGLIATVADEAVWHAMEHLRAGLPARNSTTVDLQVNYLRAATNTAVLRARARILKMGRTLCVGTVELTDCRGALCAIATVTYMLLGSR